MSDQPNTSNDAAGAWSVGSDAPEKAVVRIGFIPLTDCASVVMASERQFDRRHGVRIVLSRESSWASVRDKLVSGELDFAHVLYGLVYGTHLGIGSARTDMAVLMTLNQNGQGITVARSLALSGVTDGATLAARIAAAPPMTFAQTFPTGTHAMWLYYWLAAHGVDPFRDTRIVTVPPPQMVANLRDGLVAGFSAGEPWNHCAIVDGSGVSVATSQQIWKNHPEKVLGTTASFAQRYPNTCRAVTAAVLQASRWIDASVANKRLTADTIAQPAYVNIAPGLIVDRILGSYQNGLGATWNDPDPMRFHGDGEVNFPYLSDGMWFLTQYRRWGMLRNHPDYRAVAASVNRTDLYRQAAAAVGVPVPAEPMRSSTLVDGIPWDGSRPADYADSFAIRASRLAVDA